MEPLVFEVNHNKDLFYKVIRAQTAKDRKRGAFSAIFTSIVAALLIIGDILSENMETFEGGFFFAIMAFASCLLLKRLSKKSVRDMVDKNFENYPQRSIYTFLDDRMLFETFSKHSHSNSEYAYTAISRIQKIDNQTIYVLLKNNTYYAVESSRAQEIVDFLASKVPAECFEGKSEGETNLVALFLCALGGFMGIHQFYYKNVKFGMLYLFTAGLFGFGVIIDLIRILQAKKPIGCKSR